jgi:hypothetical protein
MIWFLGGVNNKGDFLAAVVIAIVGAGASSAVLLMIWRYWPAYLPQGVLAAMGLRIFITLGGILVWVLVSDKISRWFLFSLAGFYLLGLICETLTAIKISFRRVGPGEKIQANS